MNLTNLLRSSMIHKVLVRIIILTGLLVACQSTVPQSAGHRRILAVESFLADIAQNIAGDRLVVESLIPLGMDPHAYLPTPQDAARIADVDVLIINGADLESFLEMILQNSGGNELVITASSGLIPRPDPSGEHSEGDPHFWLDPNNVVIYVENICEGLTQADPAGSSVFAANAEEYKSELQDLDSWIRSRVQEIPLDRRILVTNHETFGYFAERYGFMLSGAILPGVSSGAAPSAKEVAALIDTIRLSGVPAIFLEIGADPQLADQIASETAVKVVSGLYTHSLGEFGGPAGSYLDMIRYNVNLIVEALR